MLPVIHTWRTYLCFKPEDARPNLLALRIIYSLPGAGGRAQKKGAAHNPKPCRRKVDALGPITGLGKMHTSTTGSASRCLMMACMSFESIDRPACQRASEQQVKRQTEI